MFVDSVMFILNHNQVFPVWEGGGETLWEMTLGVLGLPSLRGWVSRDGGWVFSGAVVLCLQAIQQTALCMFLVSSWPVALSFQGPVLLFEIYCCLGMRVFRGFWEAIMLLSFWAVSKLLVEVGRAVVDLRNSEPLSAGSCLKFLMAQAGGLSFIHIREQNQDKPFTGSLDRSQWVPGCGYRIVWSTCVFLTLCLLHWIIWGDWFWWLVLVWILSCIVIPPGLKCQLISRIRTACQLELLFINWSHK